MYPGASTEKSRYRWLSSQFLRRDACLNNICYFCVIYSKLPLVHCVPEGEAIYLPPRVPTIQIAIAKSWYKIFRGYSHRYSDQIEPAYFTATNCYRATDGVVTPERIASIKGGGRHTAHMVGRITSHIYFFVNFFGMVILPINPQKRTLDLSNREAA